MRIGVLRIGQVDPTLALRIQKDLTRVLKNTTCVTVEGDIHLKKAFDKKRNQYSSAIILQEIQAIASLNHELSQISGIADIDIFVHELNFVFGEATFPGKAALISLYRLKPEFYGNAPDPELFFQRSIKEAAHELGHTIGMGHCQHVSCVMHFSNSILDTDNKQALFCNRCNLIASRNIATFQKDNEILQNEELLHKSRQTATPATKLV